MKNVWYIEYVRVQNAMDGNTVKHVQLNARSATKGIVIAVLVLVWGSAKNVSLFTAGG